MNQIGKTMAIFTTFMSVAFLGLAFVARIGGTNWEGQAAGLENYYVDKADDKGTITYSVKERRTGEAVKQGSKLLPEVIAAAYKHESDALDTKTKTLEPEIGKVKKRREDAVTLHDLDRKAMLAKEQALVAEFQRIAKQLDDTAVEGRKVAGEAQATWNEGALRREDVYRLRNHLEELSVDQFQLQEQKKRLLDELNRLRGVLDRLQRRNVQLKSAVPYEPAAS